MAGGASAVASAGMIEMDAEVQGHVEQRFLLAVVFIGQLAVLEGNGLAFGKEGDFNRVFATFDGGSVHCGSSSALHFFVRHMKTPSFKVSRFQGFNVSKSTGQRFTVKL
jgi:hypothetical protein